MVARSAMKEWAIMTMISSAEITEGAASGESDTDTPELGPLSL